MAAVQQIFPGLGTVNTVTVFHRDEALARAAAERVKGYVLISDERLSVFKPSSEISLLNSQAGGTVHPEVLELLRLSREYSEITSGAFDITARAGASGVSSRDIILNPEELSVKFAAPGVSIDLGGIAKGFCADKIRELLAGMGISDALVNLGGTVLTIGPARPVGIRNPFTPVKGGAGDDICCELTVENAVCVTSGRYEQAEHIINPATGKAVTGGVLSVTLTGKTGAELDALATACVVMGLENSVKLIASRGIDGVFILDDGGVFATDGLKGRLKFKGSSK